MLWRVSRHHEQRAACGCGGTPEWLLVLPLRRLLTWAPDVDGRMVLLAAVAAYLAVIAAGRRVWGVDLWPMLGVPSGPSLFFDARNLTAAWECDRLGYDPLYDNPCDPWGRPLMYLRPWLLLGVLGLDQSHTVVLAAVLMAAMFLSFSALVGRVPAGTGIVLAVRRVLAGSHVRRRASEHGHRALLGADDLHSCVAGVPGRRPGSRAPSSCCWRDGEDLSGPSRCRRSSSRAAGWRPVPRCACAAASRVYLLYNLRDVAHVAEIATQGRGVLVRRAHPARASVPPDGRRPVGGSGTPEAAARPRCRSDSRRVSIAVRVRAGTAVAEEDDGRQPLRWSPSMSARSSTSALSPSPTTSITGWCFSC